MNYQGGLTHLSRIANPTVIVSNLDSLGHAAPSEIIEYIKTDPTFAELKKQGFSKIAVDVRVSAGNLSRRLTVKGAMNLEQGEPNSIRIILSKDGFFG